MGRVRRRTNKVNSIFKNPEKVIEDEELKVKKTANRQLQNFIRTQKLPVYVQNSSDAMVTYATNVVSSQVARGTGTFIDLKPYFQKSPSAKPRKDGKGWYMIIPIGAKAGEMRSKVPRTLWDLFSRGDFGTFDIKKIADDNGIKFDGLQNAIQGDTSGIISDLKYEWKSNNITRVASKNGKGKNGHYIMFRTVSDKSDPSSWIVGRQNFDMNIDKNVTEEFNQLAIVALKHKVKQYRNQQLSLL